jgi:hypothetical protein
MRKALSIDCVNVEVIIETSTKKVLGVVVHTQDLHSVTFGEGYVDDRIEYNPSGCDDEMEDSDKANEKFGKS